MPFSCKHESVREGLGMKCSCYLLVLDDCTLKNRRLNKSACVTPIKAHSPVKNHTEKRTPTHVLNNSSMHVRSMCMQYVLLYLVLAVNYRFKILRSYMLLLKLPVFMCSWYGTKIGKELKFLGTV